MNKLERQWFAITDHNELLILGDCGDAEAALEVAGGISADVFAVINADTAAQWKHIIEKQFSTCVPKVQKPNVFKRAAAKLSTVPYPVVSIKRRN